ncbi:SBP domain [Sesbania bispinosa]|nr:SBP domain [Sesbania bispinosa]
MGSGSVTKSPPPPPSSSSPPNSSTESLDGLKFGKKIYFEAAQAKPSGGASSSSSSSIGPKKGRGGAVQGAQPPRCQVEGCKVDLSGAKAYYSRHKVCGMHSKSPTVVVAGLEQSGYVLLYFPLPPLALLLTLGCPPLYTFWF